MAEPAAPLLRRLAGAIFGLMILTSVGVVLLGESNNPTILNPDFLARHVLPASPDSANLSQPPLCTPVFAQVAYDNGVTVRSEPQRILFEQGAPTPTLSRTFVAQLALAYVQTVPHVRYTAIGVNPVFIVEGGSAYDRFQNDLTSAFPMGHDGIVPRMQLKTDYVFPDRRVSIESSEARRSNEQGREELGLMLRTNIHRDIHASDPDERLQSLSKIIRNADSDISHVIDLLRSVSPFADLARDTRA